jgi:hypothetical protein
VPSANSFSCTYNRLGPPENPALLYGLLPPNYPKPVPTLIPKAFDKHAAYRFSLVIRRIVNIGVCGSELIRSRVVQAGTLDVIGFILESWLTRKGFFISPSSITMGMLSPEKLASNARHINKYRQRSVTVNRLRSLRVRSNGGKIHTMLPCKLSADRLVQASFPIILL